MIVAHFFFLKIDESRDTMRLFGGTGVQVLKNALSLCLVLGCGLFTAGCKSTPGGQEPLPRARVDSVTLEVPFNEAWQRTRQALVDQKYEIYTRDKRGLYVAYTKVKRRLLFFPHRMQLTITLEATSAEETQLTVETIHQKYRVTLLTYPDWRDDPEVEKGDVAAALLEAIRSTEVTDVETEQGGTRHRI